MNAEAIARALHGRKSGPSWLCGCPAHEDRSPSLSVRDSDGKVLVHCFAGCTQQGVVDALRNLGLWPETLRTPGQRRDFARQRRRDESDLAGARQFGAIAAALAEEALETLPWYHPDRRPLTGLLAALRTEPGVLAEFRQWRKTQPGFAQALLAAGAKHQARLETMLAGYLAMREVENAA